MNIWIFYRDSFEAGGVPDEIRSLSKALGKTCDVKLIGKHKHLNMFQIDDIQCVGYNTFFDLHRKTKELSKSQPDYILLVGFFIIDNAIFIKSLGKASISKVILYPLAHLMPFVFTRKLFTADPSVRKLENEKRPKSGNFTRKFIEKLNPLLKRTYTLTIGAYMLKNTTYIAYLSEFEAEQIRLQLRLKKHIFIRLPLGVNHPKPSQDPPYYRFGNDDAFKKLNFVYWGRLDWEFKGIDRLLDGIYELKSSNGRLDFKIFLIGPDYRNGALQIKKRILALELTEDVIVVLPGQYKSGSLAPLRDADASVLLSKWDGFPRSLRESLCLDVPVIVSQETNFADIVEKYGCGVVVYNPDDSSELAKALQRMSELALDSSANSSTNEAVSSLEWCNIAKEFVNNLSSLSEPS